MEYGKLKTSSLGISKILLTLMLLLTTSCAIYHGYDAYYGKVVDTETKEPLEGAAVLAVYHIKQYGGPGGPVTYYLDAQETLTDKNGEFKIPSNAQLTLRFLGSFDPNPHFTIFKPGYGCFPEYKGIKTFKPWWSLPANQYVTIELPSLKTKEERIKNVDCYPVGVPDAKMKKFIEISNIENKNLGLQPTHLEEKKK